MEYTRGNQASAPRNCVADYSMERVYPMLLERGGGLTLSPDGTMAATVCPDKTVEIHRLGTWWRRAGADSPRD